VPADLAGWGGEEDRGERQQIYPTATLEPEAHVESFACMESRPLQSVWPTAFLPESLAYRWATPTPGTAC
jgi:hypothetical protein